MKKAQRPNVPLLRFLGAAGTVKVAPGVHGEQDAAMALHEKIEADLGWTAAVPRQLEQVRLD
jgi:hypothetical protein